VVPGVSPGPAPTSPPGKGRRTNTHPSREHERRQEQEMTWRTMDLHLHTPASLDYQEPGVSALDILRRAEERGLEIIAFTDHNSVRGYADLWREIEDLELLEYLKRLEPEEEARLAEYRRLLDKVLLLPGFEFTAQFGFHILAIFPERTTVRMMEHLLLALGVPEDRFGSGEVGATSDVLRAYELLDEHGALVIGAHVNSTHGIAMQGLRFGGQTKIAYTQSEHLHALEVTDLQLGAQRRSTARFFNGTKPEYPRRMHCIQGSDAHRLDRDPERETNLGVGDRVTEVLLPAVSFEALKQLFLSDDFTRTRPYLARQEPVDFVKDARAEGNTLVQAFHENLSTKRTGLSLVLRDVVALANTNGGTVYVGASPFEKRAVAGVADAQAASAEFERELAAQVSPALAVSIDTLESGGKQVLAIRVPRGAEKPYALDPGGIYVRHEGESAPARRDEIVAMVREAAARPAPPAVAPAAARPKNGRDGGERAPGLALAETEVVAEGGEPGRGRRRGKRGRRPRGSVPAGPHPAPAPAPAPVQPVQSSRAAPPVPRLEEFSEDAPPDDIAPPSGVEVLHAFEQDGVRYYSLHDLRDMKYVHNVTRDTPKRLWRAAIGDREDRPLDEADVRWRGDFGLWRAYKPRGGEQRYNLVYRGDGDLRVFYGVSDDGLDDQWRAVLAGRRG
jgi:hypothetical protein